MLQQHDGFCVFDFASIYHIISLIKIQFQHFNIFLLASHSPSITYSSSFSEYAATKK